MSNVKHLDLTDIAEEALTITMKVGEEVREFIIRDPSVSVMIAAQSSQDAAKALKEEGANEPGKVLDVQRELAYAILSMDNEITREEVKQISFVALTRLINYVSKEVDNAFLGEGSPSKPAAKSAKGKATKKKTTSSTDTV